MEIPLSIGAKFRVSRIRGEQAFVKGLSTVITSEIAAESRTNKEKLLK